VHTRGKERRGEEGRGKEGRGKEGMLYKNKRLMSLIQSTITCPTKG
jgi:hypothetical protein